jgi:hypothetical protein
MKTVKVLFCNSKRLSLKGYTVILLLCLVAIFQTGCNKTETKTIDNGFNYYPLTPGHYITYSVDSFYYSATNYPTIRIDTVHYEIKELVDTSFIDNEGRTSYRIERYRRANNLDDWALDRIWSVNNNKLIVDKNEDDLHFIKLVFPVLEGKTWNGNGMIVAQDENEYLKDWSYKYVDVNTSFVVGAETFDSTLTVLQIDNENLIEKKFAYEKYARGVGMVYKEIKFLGKQNDLSNGWNYPETGIWVRYVYTGKGE